MVGNLFCLLREILFILCIGQRPNSARCLQGTLVHSYVVHYAFPVGFRQGARRSGEFLAGATALPRPDQSHDGRGH